MDTDLFLRSNRAPNPAERTIISSMIQRDEQTLVFLQAHAEKCIIGDNKARSAVSTQSDRLSKAKYRCEAAISLLEALKHSVATIGQVNMTLNQDHSMNDQETEDISVLHNEELRVMIQARSDACTHLQEHIDKAERSVHKQTETVAMAKEDLQALLSIERLSRMAVESVDTQIYQLKSSLEKKKNMFRSIWRVNSDVWRIIFTYSGFIPPKQEDSLYWEVESPTWPAWRQPLVISAVCHQWRVICRNYPPLWRDAVVVYGKKRTFAASKNDLELFVQLSTSTLHTLTVVMGAIQPEVYANLLSTLQSINSLKILHYISSKGLQDRFSHTVILREFCQSIPSISEVYVRGSKSNVMPISIKSACTSLVTLGCLNAYPVDLLETKLQKLMIITRNTKLTTILPLLRIHGSHLKVLDVAGDVQPDADRPRISLEKLEDLAMDFKSLTKSLSSSFYLPRLRRLNIMGCNNTDIVDAETFLASGDHIDRIEEVALYDMGVGDLPILNRFLTQLRSVRRLIVHEGCVDLFLQVGTNALVRDPTMLDDQSSFVLNLEELIVRSYDGDGTVVLYFVMAVVETQRRCMESSEYTDGDSEDASIAFERVVYWGCPHISTSMQKAISEKITSMD